MTASPQPAAPSRSLHARFLAFVVAREEVAWGPGTVLALLAGVIAVRNLLEIAVAQNPIYASIQGLVHYPLAYAAPFIALTLVLATWSKVAPARVARLMALAWLLTLLPPLVDVLLGRHNESPTIGYLQIDPRELPFVLLRFFDPRVAFPGTTAGIRVEAFGAVVLGALYVGLRSRSIARALGAACEIYLVSLFFFTLPTLMLGLFQLVGAGLTQSAFFHLEGLLAHTDADTVGDTLAICWLVPILCGLTAFWRGAERRLGAPHWFNVAAGPPRFGWLAPALLLVGTLWAGINAGVSLAAPHGDASRLAPFDTLVVIGATLAVLLATYALARRDHVGVWAALGAIALAAGLGRSAAATLAGVAGALMVPATSAAAPRWRRLALGVAVSVAAYASFLTGWSLVTGTEALARLPTGVSTYAFVVCALGGGAVGWGADRWSQGWRAGFAGTALAVVAIVAVWLALHDDARRERWAQQADCVARLERLTAQKAYEEGKYAGARLAWERALQCSPSDAEALRGIGLVLLRQDKKPEEALDYLQRAVAAAPDSPQERINLGAAYMDLKRYADAAAAFEAGRRLSPRDPRLVFNHAQALLGLGDRSRAEQTYREFLDLAGSRPDLAQLVALAQQQRAKLLAPPSTAPPAEQR